MYNPPVLLLIYRRPDLVSKLVVALRAARPDKIYVASDGPRKDQPSEIAQCKMALKALSGIDWPCQVRTLIREDHLGVREAVSQAIDWFFSWEDEGIILEEDCIPHEDFFGFCGELLAKYRDQYEVMQISGTNFQPKRRSKTASYFASRYNHVWGWATWKRAWRMFRRNMEGLELFLAESDQNGFWASRKERKYWRKIFTSTQKGQVQSWAYRWKYTLWATGGVCLYPESNLISNQGFGKTATNTKYFDRTKGARPTEAAMPLVHPTDLVVNTAADRWTFERHYWGTPMSRALQRSRKLVAIVGVLLRLSDAHGAFPVRHPRAKKLQDENRALEPETLQAVSL